MTTATDQMTAYYVERRRNISIKKKIMIENFGPLNEGSTNLALGLMTDSSFN